VTRHYRTLSTGSLRQVFCLWVLLASGCTTSLVNYEAVTHVVRPGDTLYTIAWRYGLDYQQLARFNGLKNPDLIYVGQRLSLRAGNAPREVQSRTTAPVPRPLPAVLRLPSPAWQWPTEGKLIRNFGSSDGLGNGIAIGGSVGQAIHAAAPGRVVYAGNGLIGYGQLVIVKHNDTYLSAYGHNSRLIVSQGDDVARGQTIAEMGIGPERQPQLHFEIRSNGSPVDPLEHFAR
jgi:lipoprotein NlpD